jgi:hypothetical protein
MAWQVVVLSVRVSGRVILAQQFTAGVDERRDCSPWSGRLKGIPSISTVRFADLVLDSLPTQR